MRPLGAFSSVVSHRAFQGLTENTAGDCALFLLPQWKQGQTRRKKCMAMGRVEFRDGRAIAYDELGRKRTEKICDKLVGYGPKGFVIKVNWAYSAHDPNGVIIEQGIPERVFLDKKQWDWHDSFLRVRV